MLIARLFANKFLLIASSITLVILVLILVLTNSPKSTLEAPPDSSIQTDNPFSGFADLTEDKINNAINYRSLISDRLPIYYPNFKTSVGITTTISISIDPLDPTITRFDISGLSYLNKNELDPIKNPNLSAFKESYLKALELLRESGIEPKQLIFDYAQAGYVKDVATYWVDNLALLR